MIIDYYGASNNIFSLAQKGIRENLTPILNYSLVALDGIANIGDLIAEGSWYSRCVSSQTATECAPYFLKKVYNQFWSVIEGKIAPQEAVVNGIDSASESIWDSLCLFNPTVKECYPLVVKRVYNQFWSVIEGKSAPQEAVIKGIDSASEMITSALCTINPSFKGCYPLVLKKIYNNAPLLAKGEIVPLVRNTLDMAFNFSFTYSFAHCMRRHWSQCAKGIVATVALKGFNYFI